MKYILYILIDLKYRMLNGKYINMYARYNSFISNDCVIYNVINYVYTHAGHYTILFFVVYDLISILS
jgi:hypothetical protein